MARAFAHQLVEVTQADAASLEATWPSLSVHLKLSELNLSAMLTTDFMQTAVGYYTLVVP